MRLKPEQLAFHPFSYADESARVFSWEGGIYRAISRERAPFYHYLLSKGVLSDLMQRQMLVDTEIADLELDGCALVLKHRTIPFVSHCYEWCGEMLKAAALSVLELERELLRHGLTLQDAHPYNILFDGPMPVWVDWGSLVPVRYGEPWHGYDEFLAFYTRPLKIMAAGHTHIARCLLRDGEYGVRQRDVEAITGTSLAEMVERAKTGTRAAAAKAVPWTFRSFFSRAIRSTPISQPLGRKKEPISSINRASHEIQNIRLVQPRPDRCSKNFPEFVSTTHWTDKQRSVAQILSAKRPRSVLDIASNLGWYSQFAARNGARVVSVDRDESMVTKLFFDAVEGQFPIVPVVADFRNLNPLMAWAAAPGQAYVDRFRCDMVLALGLVHHLVFEQGLNFDLIVRGLSAFAKECLAVEFVGREDPYVRDQLSGRFSWYSLENFLAVLKREFHVQKTFPSDEEHRCVILCDR